MLRHDVRTFRLEGDSLNLAENMLLASENIVELLRSVHSNQQQHRNVKIPNRPFGTDRDRLSSKGGIAMLGGCPIP